MRRIATTVGALLAISVLAACSSESPSWKSDSPAKPETFDVAGTLILPGGCGSSFNNDYGGIDDGAQIGILDSASETVALGRLSDGVDARGGQGPCTYEIAVANVPVGDSDIFGLSIGGREPYQFTQAEAGSLNLSLGEFGE